MSSYKSYFAIEKKIKSKGIDIQRDELIYAFTNGKKSSLKALSEWEFKEFLNWLKTRFELSNKSKPWQGTSEDKMRKKLIQLFVHEMGYTIKGLNDWCVKYGKFHKILNKHTLEELTIILSIAKTKVYPNFMKNVN